MILIASALAVRSSLNNYLAEGRYVYLMHKAQLLLEIEAKQAALRRGVIYAEMLWPDRRKPRAQLIRDFAANGGRVVIQASRKVNPQLALGELGEQRPAAAFSDYLSLAEEQAYIASASARQRQLDLTGYFYDLNDTFIAIMPPPRSGNPLKNTGTGDVTELIKRLAPDIGNLRDPVVAKRLRQSRSIAWLPTARDPFTGEEVFKLVQPAFDGDHAFLVFVNNLPIKILKDRLHQTAYDGNFIIFGTDGKPELSSWYQRETDPGLSQRISDNKSWLEKLDTSEYFYNAGTFTISEPLSDTGLVLAYAYSWRTILAARWPQLLMYVTGMMAILSVLWMFLLLFDRKVFLPVFLRSQRVFESERLNRTIISAAPVGLSLLSIRRGETLLQNKIMQAYDSQVAPLYRQFLDLYWSLTKAPSTNRYQQIVGHQMSIKLANGNTAHLLVNLSAVKYQGGQALLCSFSDITVGKQLEQKLEQARIDADIANHAKSGFLATMSHEIRTPLNAILGNLELLGHSPLSDMQADRLETITSSSKALLNIITDILDFSKVESGQMTLENMRFDVIDLIEQCAIVFGPLTDAKGINLFYAVAPDMPRFFYGDPARLRQILLNLLSNAIKFTDSGKVSIVMDSRTTGLTIRVSDTGIGMTAAQQRDLFQPFRQADVSISRRFGGSGLGLALCKRLADLMGGTISLESRPAVGTTFSLSLPLQADTNALQATPFFLDKTTIFMLCLSAEWRVFISEQLTHWGLDVQLISHPREMMAEFPLLIFGNPRNWSVAEEDRLYGQASQVIDALDDGPRTALITGKRTIVSCYSSLGLRNAIALALAPASTALAVEDNVMKSVYRLPGQRQIRVLVLEDHPINLALIRDQLDALGYQSDLANNGKTALLLFKKKQYDIVLTDLNMPNMDGYTFSTLLRRQGARLPIIAITAHTSTDERRRCDRVGITDMLLKPMSLGEIAHMVGKHVQERGNDILPSTFVTTPLKMTLSAELRQKLYTINMHSIDEIRHGLLTGDMQVVLAQLHLIKGVFSMLHEADIVAVCTRMEEFSLSANLAALTDALPGFETLLQLQSRSSQGETM